MERASRTSRTARTARFRCCAAMAAETRSVIAREGTVLPSFRLLTIVPFSAPTPSPHPSANPPAKRLRNCHVRIQVAGKPCRIGC